MLCLCHYPYPDEQCVWLLQYIYHHPLAHPFYVPQGSNTALGRQTAQHDGDADSTDSSTSGMAVDGSEATCTAINGTNANPTWWRVNLTTPQEVVFVTINTNTPMESATIYVTNTSDPDKWAGGHKCSTGSVDTGTSGVWCNGTPQGMYGVVGQFVWVVSDSFLSLCEVDVYAQSTCVWGCILDCGGGKVGVLSSHHYCPLIIIVLSSLLSSHHYQQPPLTTTSLLPPTTQQQAMQRSSKTQLPAPPSPPPMVPNPPSQSTTTPPLPTYSPLPVPLPTSPWTWDTLVVWGRCRSTTPRQPPCGWRWRSVTVQGPMGRWMVARMQCVLQIIWCWRVEWPRCCHVIMELGGLLRCGF